MVSWCPGLFTLYRYTVTPVTTCWGSSRSCRTRRPGSWPDSAGEQQLEPFWTKKDGYRWSSSMYTTVFSLFSKCNTVESQHIWKKSSEIILLIKPDKQLPAALFWMTILGLKNEGNLLFTITSLHGILYPQTWEKLRNLQCSNWNWKNGLRRMFQSEMP